MLHKAACIVSSITSSTMNICVTIVNLRCAYVTTHYYCHNHHHHHQRCTRSRISRSESRLDSEMLDLMRSSPDPTFTLPYLLKTIIHNCNCHQLYNLFYFLYSHFINLSVFCCNNFLFILFI